MSVVQSITAMPAIAKENGGGAWGWYTSATLTFNPMYGAVANTYATVDAVQAGDVEAATFHATSAVQTTAITAATLYLPAKGGIGAMTGKGTRPTTTVNGGGGRRATVPEATTPELPATAANTASRAGWSVGDDIYSATRAGNSPSWSTVRARFWKNEAANPQYGTWTDEQLARMSSGRAPQRYNPDKGGLESMDLSHEPVPFRDGGTTVVPRWPQDHAAVDPFRHPGY